MNWKITRLLILPLLGVPLAAQTEVDLRTQAKSADFTGFQSTRPLKAGSVLPVTCNVGEMFFLTSAAAGTNIYACTTANTWVVQTGGGAGATTVQNNGTVVGLRPILDLHSGQGVVVSASDTGQSISIQAAVDTAQVQTRATDQAGSSLFCNSSSGSATVYTCALTPTLTAYSIGMVMHWKPDVSGTGAPATLNIDSLGAIPVKLADGATDPGLGDLVAGRLLELWYDGVTFRVLEPIIPAGVLGEVQPACAATVRGRFWYKAGMAGVKDNVSVCAKNASDVYAWIVIF